MFRKRKDKSRASTRRRYFGISEGSFHGGVFAPDLPDACFHVGITGPDGKVLFSTRADRPSQKDTIPDGHGFALPVPLEWLGSQEERLFQFKVIETGELFPKEPRALPVERLNKSFKGVARAGGNIRKRIESATSLLSSLDPEKTVILGTHEMTRTGAPLILLEIARHLHHHNGRDIILLCDGPADVLFPDFDQFCRVILDDLQTGLKICPKESNRFFEKAAALTEGRSRALVNSICSGKLALACVSVGIPVVCLVHEFPWVFPHEFIQRLFDSANHVIFPCAPVRHAYIEAGLVSPEDSRFSIKPQGCYQLELPPLSEESLAEFAEKFRTSHGLRPEDRIIVSCGTADTRKGFDWFVALIGSMEEENFHFVWIGKAPDLSLLHHAEQELRLKGLHSRFHHFEEMRDVRPALKMADAFLLCSRVDPFPSVVLESFALGVPVIGFDQGQGSREIIKETGFGGIVPYLDTAAATRAIARISAPDSEARARVTRGGAEYVRTHFRYEDYVNHLAGLLFENQTSPIVRKAVATPPPKPSPLESGAEVTVCVPVYRRGEKLESTLRSLKEQTFENFEVLLGLEPVDGDEATLSVCEKYGSEDARFHVRKNPQVMGWGGNIRSLMQQVTTPFFMILPHDDALHPQCLEKLVEAAQRNADAVVVYPDIYFFGGVDGRQFVRSQNGEREERLKDYFLRGGDPEFWKGLTRRSLLEKGDAFPVNGMKSFASEYEWALVLLSRGAIHRVPTPLYYKRIHGADSDSVSTHWIHRMSEAERMAELRAHGERMLALAGGAENSEELQVACNLAWLRRVLEFNGEDAVFLPGESTLLESLIPRISDSVRGADRFHSCVSVLRAREASAKTDHIEAEKLFRQAIEQWPDNREAKFLLIKCLLRQARTDEALTHFIELHDELPRSAPEWRCGEILNWIANELKHRLGS